jgi:hypothetical protein
MTVLEINLCLPMTTAALPNGSKVAKAANTSHPGLKYFAPGVNCVSAAARYPVISRTKVRWIV